MITNLRHYNAGDLTACLDIFSSNVPDYFHADEAPVFAESLTSNTWLPPRLRNSGIKPGCFYVLEEKSGILGCGGWYLDGDIANLSWGMIARHRQRKGLGTALLEQRINLIIRHGGVRMIRIRTSSKVQAFYERNGFTVVGRNQQGLVDSIPLVELVKIL